MTETSEVLKQIREASRRAERAIEEALRLQRQVVAFSALLAGKSLPEDVPQPELAWPETECPDCGILWDTSCYPKCPNCARNRRGKYCSKCGCRMADSDSHRC